MLSKAHFVLGNWFVILMAMSAALQSVWADERVEAPRISVSKLPERVVISEPISLAVTFSWQGGDDQFQFLIPEIPIRNLKLVQIAQASEKGGRSTTKKFTFEFEPIQTGEAVIESFSFPYQTKGGDHLVKNEIKGARLKVVNKFPDPFGKPLAGLLVAVGSLLGLVGFAYGLIHQRKKGAAKLVKTPKIASLETKKLNDLQALKSKSQSDLESRELFVKLSQLFSDYCVQKWGACSREFFVSHETGKEIKEENTKAALVLLDQIETFKFSGEPLGNQALSQLFNEIQLFIEHHRVFEPPSPNN